ncbi:glucan endo-1,3-beta-glucosidase 11-like [Pyrus ussuriensis x Pyrus communis]|uniref:Glucan endo-1,3-beta-glucosidase 11-like n=1 Tax=Pyrus ussuriensis x Pyrus communis TaxID=2448454 RepID=A0A5N5HKE8_9ROSA|nr:glucan endo-1,3-beta-glucosidase 11-like [Pyrus ussuriensis x Pyrus communis]
MRQFQRNASSQFSASASLGLSGDGNLGPPIPLVVAAFRVDEWNPGGFGFKQVAVTTAHSLSTLETSYPPSAGAFCRDLTACITSTLNFHTKGCFVVLICREEKEEREFWGKGRGWVFGEGEKA